MFFRIRLKLFWLRDSINAPRPRFDPESFGYDVATWSITVVVVVVVSEGYYDEKRDDLMLMVMMILMIG